MDYRKSKTWMVATCLLLAMGNMGHAAVVRFYESATVDGTVVTLGDIADVRDVDPTVTQSLREIILGPAPAAGTEKPFAFADMRARLRAVGINISNIEFSGHSVVRVRSSRVMQTALTLQPITQRHQTDTPREPSRLEIRQTKERLIQAVRQTIRQRWPELQLDTVYVSLVPGSASATNRNTLLTMTESQSINLTGWQGPVDSPQMLTAITSDSQGEAIHLAIRCQIKIQPFVLTVAESIPRGHIVQATDLKWIQAPSDTRAVTDPTNVIGRQTKRSLRRGETLESNDLERVLLVRTRDIVTVAVRSGGITVRREMKSLGDGALNEPITLVSLTGQDRITARVTGAHTAEVPLAMDSVPASQVYAGANR